MTPSATPTPTESPSETPTSSSVEVSATPSPSQTPILPSPTPRIVVLPYISLTNPECLPKTTFESSRRVKPRRGLKIGSRTHSSLFVSQQFVLIFS